MCVELVTFSVVDDYKTRTKSTILHNYVKLKTELNFQKSCSFCCSIVKLPIRFKIHNGKK